MTTIEVDVTGITKGNWIFKVTEDGSVLHTQEFCWDIDCKIIGLQNKWN